MHLWFIGKRRDSFVCIRKTKQIPATYLFSFVHLDRRDEKKPVAQFHKVDSEFKLKEEKDNSEDHRHYVVASGPFEHRTYLNFILDRTTGPRYFVVSGFVGAVKLSQTTTWFIPARSKFVTS